MYQRRGEHQAYYVLGTRHVLMRGPALPDILIVVTLAIYTYVPLLGLPHASGSDRLLDGTERRFPALTALPPGSLLASNSVVSI